MSSGFGLKYAYLEVLGKAAWEYLLGILIFPVVKGINHCWHCISSKGLWMRKTKHGNLFRQANPGSSLLMCWPGNNLLITWPGNDFQSFKDYKPPRECLNVSALKINIHTWTVSQGLWNLTDNLLVSLGPQVKSFCVITSHFSLLLLTIWLWTN